MARTSFDRAAVCLLACAMLSACTGNTPYDGPTVFVQVRSGGDLCGIRDVEVKCAEAAHYLRDVLKVKSDEYIAVAVDSTHESNPSGSMTAVINSLEQSGFTTVIGLVPLPKGGA
jgi:hypothetical protein